VHNFLRSLLSIGVIIFGLVVSGPGLGQQDGSAAPLRLVGLDGVQHEVSAQDWAKLPRGTVKAEDHGGAIVTFEGVPALELLKLVAAPLGHELRGQQMSLYVLAEGADGYKVVYALPEFDPDFTDGLILIADRKNGEALPPKEGSLRVVVPWEKRQARWVRQLTVLRVRQAP
jgi:DMSO/TMAO reductase YedYZ molybdopterin-dependent catalytic subunit